MDDFNFDEWAGNSHADFNSNLHEWQEKIMISSIESNFKKIKEKGIDELQLRTISSSEIKDLQNTLQIMIEHYKELEEYRNCKIIFDNLEKINKVLGKQNI